ncbi:MAG: hypothetical protein ACK5XN_38745 [Bacteroidota bacterium]
MNEIYLAIVLLTVYGDIVKRYLPASVAIGGLYALALAILIWITVKNSSQKKVKSFLSFEERQIVNCIYFLVGIYALELLTSSSTLLVSAISASSYILVPLGYTLVTIKYCPQFNDTIFAQMFHVAMIPVNIIGLIQFRIDPNFFVSQNYSETGGVIYRNLFEGEKFARFPSLFASADRYSAMGLIQLYLAFVLLLNGQIKSKFKIAWVFFNILSGLTAMSISGARSRLLISSVALILLGLTTFMSFFTFSKTKNLFKPIFEFLLILVFIGIAIGLIYPDVFLSLGQEINNFQVLEFLQQSIGEGDVQGRVDQAIQFSLIPEGTSLLGEGLGSLGNKPTEFGINAFWVESGLLWGIPKLFAFLGIILIFFSLAFRAFVKLQPLRTTIFIIPPLILCFGLLTGLTGAFELSSGILFCVCMGFIIKSSKFIYFLE